MAARSLDLHGVRAHEVEEKLDRFLFQSQSAGLKEVRVVTGKGTGTVLTIVKAYLKKGGYPFYHEKTPQGAANPGVLIVVVN